MHYGVDIADTRLDDMDRQAVFAVGEMTEALVLDLGCGSGGLAAALAAKGAQVVAIDIADYAARIARRSEGQNVTFYQADIRNVPKEVLSQQYSHIILQRTLHYLPYTDALEVLKQLRTLTNGTLYVSVTGCDTEIGRHYTECTTPIADRFATLTAPGTELFSITAPICLYSQTEFTTLLATAGWEVESVWTSAFGNHKAVCR